MNQTKDILMNHYFGNPVIFADFYNGFLFDGRQVLSAEDLAAFPVDEKELFGSDPKGALPVIRYRDSICQTNVGTDLILLALENETKLDYTMIVRILLYDAMTYQQQVRQKQQYNKSHGGFRNKNEFYCKWKKEDKIRPVITYVLYYGEDSWDGARCLADFVQLDSYSAEIQRHFQDYRLHLIDAGNVSHLERFHSELRVFFTLLSVRGNPGKLRKLLEQKEIELNISRQGARLVSALWYGEAENTISQLLEKILEEIPEEGGMTNMSSVIDLLCEEIREESLKEGENRFGELASRLLSEKKYDMLHKASTDKAYRDALFREYQL